MSEILSIHIGGCGIRLGGLFWQRLCDEHAIDYSGKPKGNPGFDQLEGARVFFTDAGNGALRPRALFVDLADDANDNLEKSPIGKIFAADAAVTPKKSKKFWATPEGDTSKGQYWGSALGNWARARYVEGDFAIKDIMRAIRREAAACKNLQGFIITHAAAGGAGGGLGSYILSRLNQEYPDKTIVTFTVFAGPKADDGIYSPYNIAFALKNLTDMANLVFCFDSDSLYDLDFRCPPKRRKIKTNVHERELYNDFIVEGMMGASALLRIRSRNLIPPPPLPPEPDEDRDYHAWMGWNIARRASEDAPPQYAENPLVTLQDMVKLLVPTGSPKLHFLNVSLTSIGEFRGYQESDLYVKLLYDENRLFQGDAWTMKTITAVAIFQNPTMEDRLSEFWSNFAKRKSMSNFQWIEANQLVVFELSPTPSGLVHPMILLNNESAIGEMFARISTAFDLMFEQKWGVHLYTCYGAEETDFEEAGANLASLMTAYQHFDRPKEVDELVDNPEGT